MTDQITARIQRAELLGLLHATLENDLATKRMPAPPLPARMPASTLAPPTNTNAMSASTVAPPTNTNAMSASTLAPPTEMAAMPAPSESMNGVVADDIDPELDNAIQRMTTIPHALPYATIPAIEAAIDAAIERVAAEMERGYETAVIAAPRPSDRAAAVTGMMLICFCVAVLLGCTITLAFCAGVSS